MMASASETRKRPDTKEGGSSQQKEMLLFQFLRANGREKLTKVSRSTGIPVSTIFDILRKHEGGIITKHTCLLDFAQLGYNARASVMLKVDSIDKDRLGSHLAKHPAINTVYRITNGYDFLVEGIFERVNDAEHFLDELSKQFRITEKQAHFIVEDVKREGFMSNAQTPWGHFS